MDAQELCKLKDQLFSRRDSLLSFWQEVAEAFYPQRADFTATRTIGEDFGAHLTTSYPVLASSELANTLGSMLRPKDRDWFFVKASRPERIDHEGNMWLEWATGTMRRAMYDNLSGFTRATKEGDFDYANFGQCVISTELNRARTSFLYRAWHLRDCAWSEGYDGFVSHFCRLWKPTAKQAKELFREKVSKDIDDALRNNEPFKTFNFAHLVIPADGVHRQPWRSVFLDLDHKEIAEDVGSNSRIYTVPRWQTVSGSPYAYSPSVVAALPDARLIQAITLTLLDAGEMYASPPMIAVQEAIRGDIDVRPRGITWVDSAYDERLGEVLRPLNQDARGYPIAESAREESRNMIASAFYLNKLSLPPPTSAEMTAYEVSQRVQEFIRTTLPLFEPIEADYNGAICNETFEIGLRNGMFGPLDSIPQSLRNQEIEFKFVSPISAARDKEKGMQFMEAKNLLLEAAQLDPSAMQLMDVPSAIRDALAGINTPTRWVQSPANFAALQRQQKEQQESMEMLAGAGSIADTASKAGNAARNFSAAQQQQAA